MLQVRRILYPTDFSRCANQAFSRAFYLAKHYGAELHMLHAIVLHDDDPHSPMYHLPDIEEIQIKLNKTATDAMDSVIESYHADSIAVKKVQRRGVAPATVILEYASSDDIDLIVMGTHGRRGVSHLLLGSVAEEVVRHAQCPVLTVCEAEEPKPVEELEYVLVPLDFSEHAKSALTHAKEIAAVFNARLQLLHVVEETIHPAFYATGWTSVFEFMPDIKAGSEQAMQKMLSETKGPEVEVDFHVIEGRASSDIVKFAKNNDSDLVVIATHGLTGIEHLLIGSVAEKVVRMALCPVFTVKPFGKSLV